MGPVTLAGSSASHQQNPSPPAASRGRIHKYPLHPLNVRAKWVAPMSNYAVWNVRLRHESLQKPQKGKYLSRRKRSRIGLQDALDRKSGVQSEQASGAAAES
jgi:hypothetical protein